MTKEIVNYKAPLIYHPAEIQQHVIRNTIEKFKEILLTAAAAGQGSHSSSPDQRQGSAGKHQVNKQFRSLQTRRATDKRGNKPTATGKKEQETEVYKATVQSQPRGPTAEPAKPQTHMQSIMHTCPPQSWVIRCSNHHLQRGARSTQSSVYLANRGHREWGPLWSELIFQADQRNTGGILSRYSSHAHTKYLKSLLRKH